MWTERVFAVQLAELLDERSYRGAVVEPGSDISTCSIPHLQARLWGEAERATDGGGEPEGVVRVAGVSGDAVDHLVAQAASGSRHDWGSARGVCLDGDPPERLSL
jgi:hypothetical protein